MHIHPFTRPRVIAYCRFPVKGLGYSMKRDHPACREVNMIVGLAKGLPAVAQIAAEE